MKSARLGQGNGKTSFMTVSKCLTHGDHVRCARWSRASLRAFGTTRTYLSKDGEPVFSQFKSVKDKLAAREFFLSILSSSTTKRDAKSYISRFNPPVQAKPEPARSNKKDAAANRNGRGAKEQFDHSMTKSGVNLGSLYTFPKVIEESPVFSQQLETRTLLKESIEPLHMAIIKLRNPQSLDDETLDGVALTFAQLSQLGLLSAIVLDCDPDYALVEEDTTPQWRMEILHQAHRVAGAIRKHNSNGARVVGQAMGIAITDSDIPSMSPVRGRLCVRIKTLISSPLRQGVIPIIPPLAYTLESHVKRVQPDDVTLALTRLFTGLESIAEKRDNAAGIGSASNFLRKVTLDRIIVLDPLGGLPANNRVDNAHIFVNLDQEYEEIRKELQHDSMTGSEMKQEIEQEASSFLGRSNPFSKFVEQEIAPAPGRITEVSKTLRSDASPELSRSVRNLDLIRNALSLLPPSSSALLTTPAEAASSAVSSRSNTLTGVRTRPKRNPLIHNLLTDRPVVSSSLPAARTSSDDTKTIPVATPPTFFKRGMPVTMVPDPRSHPWTPPTPDSPSLRLETDPRIDFGRLLHLIEDSFGRPLDVKHYLNRIAGNIAGVIIAGEYEGGAILTWEHPRPRASGDSGVLMPRPPVPYLDKFAVLRKSQGSGGVADIVFNAMVRTSFPDGVVWRSRVDNPVNKWYFERATGTWKIPRTNWCMFWTGEAADVLQGGRLADYIDVCGGIRPSWADGKVPD